MNEGNNFNQNGVPVQEPVQPIQQPVYQQPVQPEPPKKSSKGIIILLIIIILALIGYIVYDKDLLNLKKEDNTNTSEKEKDKPAEKEIKELSNFSTNKLTEQSNVTENGKTYYKVLTYVDGDLKIDFKFFSIKSSETYNIKYDLYINGNKKDTIAIFEEDIEDMEYNEEDFNTMNEDALTNFKKTIGTIKGDKYYFYIVNASEDPLTFTVINEKGIVLSNTIKGYNGYGGYVRIIQGDDCESFRFSEADSEGDHIGNYTIVIDGIYYFDLNGKNDCTLGENDLASEYKLAVSNDQVTATKVKSCHVKFGNGRC